MSSVAADGVYVFWAFFFIAMFVVLFVNAVVGEAINFVDDGLWRGEKNREGKRKDFTFYYSSSIISCFFFPMHTALCFCY